MDKKNTTLKDIADKAGVTITAVSRALRDCDDISGETKKRIQEIAKEMSYKKNVLASSLRTGSLDVVGVLVPDNSNPYFARMIKGIEDTAKKSGFTVLVINTNEDASEEKKSVSILLSLRVAAILAVAVEIRSYEDINIPLVFLSRYQGEPELENFSYVVNDDIKGIELAVQHLVKLNRKIYFINGPRDWKAGKHRLVGFESAMNQAGRNYTKQDIIYTENNPDGGYTAFNTLMSNIELPCSILCCTDYIALGVLKAIKCFNLKVPQDISIMGYDDIEFLDFLATPLTSIRQSRYSIGQKAAEFVFGELFSMNKYKSNYRMTLEPELVIRDSTRIF